MIFVLIYLKLGMILKKYNIGYKGLLMEMILNENDIIVGAQFENGTIQDYVDEANTYGLVRIENTTAHWFLYNDEDSPEDIKALYQSIIKQSNHYIQDDHGEKMVIFDKTDDISYEVLASKIDEYLDAEMGSII